MPLDPAANFVRDTLQSGVTDTDTTFSVNDAAQFPDPSTDGEYNVVVWDAANNPRPDQDPDVEIVRVTAVDTSANELTVTRAQEDTTAASHPVESGVLLAPTAKDTSDTVAALNARPESPVGVDDLADGLGTGASTRLGGTTYLNSHDSLEAVEKVHNGVVYAGHPDFATLQDAVDFAANDQSVLLEPDVTYSEGADFNITVKNLIGHRNARGSDPVEADSITLEEANASGVDFDGSIEILTPSDIDQNFVTYHDCRFDGDLTITDNNPGGCLINSSYIPETTIECDRTVITSCYTNIFIEITINADDCIFANNIQRRNGTMDITINGDNNIVTGNAKSSITDNGTGNEVGFNT